MKILAIDYGEKRLGFAWGDTSSAMAIPLCQHNWKNKHHALQIIRQVIADHEVQQIIIGYPLNMDGTLSLTGEKVDRFIRFLEKRISLPILRVEERLTSWEAEEILKQRMHDFRKRKKYLDSISAEIILRNYLDQL